MKAVVGCLCAIALLHGLCDARQIPHAQDKPPGPPLSPSEAIAKMQVPPGFEVKLFAAEPDLVNPVAMTFDERGRVWVTESVEYPRKPAGKGRDRIKILEDTDGDGRADKVTIFADGLNIPSGIALGYGGVFIANAPDLLFLKDTDGDDKADTREVLVTGFGRNDTHELPNCLTWGPDGWLYGLNGVFNHSTVVHQGKTHKFNCALWRFHPKTHAFEIFASGTSNPWGLEYNRDGEFFVSACVIDHLWHLTETGYYRRQSGAYPPSTWPIESIVDYKHQKAAYCGLCQYDADIYPEDYRGTLMMGNIHGGCINNDSIERFGASYKGKPRPDFLTANDAWFMPVVQKVGPDGCLWILDWYDRYHCYQDAGRDPAGIDRLRGRLYRVTYKGTPMAPKFDLRKQADSELLKMLGNSNVFFRRWARQILIERNSIHGQLETLATSQAASVVQRLEALWTLADAALSPKTLDVLIVDPNPVIRKWAIRSLSNQSDTADTSVSKVVAAASDSDPGVRTQAIISTKTFAPEKRLDVALSALSAVPADESGLLARIAWKHMEPILDQSAGRISTMLKTGNLAGRSDFAELLPRILERLLAEPRNHDTVVGIVEALQASTEPKVVQVAAACLDRLVEGALAGRFDSARFSRFGAALERVFSNARPSATADPRWSVSLAMRLLQNDNGAVKQASATVSDRSQMPSRRALLFQALLSKFESAALPLAFDAIRSRESESDPVLRDMLNSLGRSSSPDVAKQLLVDFPQLQPSIRPQVLDLLSSRPIWAKPLLAAIAEKKIPTAVVNVNQIRKMRNMPDAECKRRVAEIWGTIREERNRQREHVVDIYEDLIETKPGNAAAGAKVFTRVCAQCHQYRNEGFAVGPSLNENGRSSLKQLLSNILDPNLVIGKDYQARVVVTNDGRVVTGLIQEDSPEKIVLKVAGGKLESFKRLDIEQSRESKISLMPEELEKQTTDQEFRDLIAYLLTDIPNAKSHGKK